MALEMKVYREVKAYEARVMWGLSSRQLGALAIGVPIAGLLFAGVTYGLRHKGLSWDEATNVAMLFIFPVLIPMAAWGWWRPKGLKPETYFRYLIQYYRSGKVITYGKTYGEGVDPKIQSVPHAFADKARGTQRSARRQGRKRRTLVPQEHSR